MFGFGGGYAMLSLIQYEVVDHHHWLTLQQFTDVVAISQMTPGPIGINSATYVGYAVTQSVWGAVVTTIAVCLPSFILVLLISYFFVKCKDNKYIKAAMSGLLPMSVTLFRSRVKYMKLCCADMHLRLLCFPRFLHFPCAGWATIPRGLPLS